MPHSPHRPPRRPVRFLAVLALLVFPGADRSAPAQVGRAAAGQAVESARGYASDFLDRVWPEDFEFDPADTAHWSDMMDLALHAQDVETLAWLSPYAHEAYDYAHSIPTLEPVADWLRPRLDYFELAEAAVSQVQEIRPPSTPVKPPPPLPRPRVTSPPRPTPAPRVSAARPPAPAPASAALKEKRRKTVRNPENWKKKLASRPAPDSADDLVPALKTAFRREGVPAELVWLAEVESSLNPGARSPAGALGLFQLMPPTAKQYGLNVASPDERRDPGKSAQAAARCLKDLYRQFGSWPLALAAYNSGAGRVGKALKQSGGKTFEDIADSLPMETQMYVPKVLALVSLREKTDAAALPPPA